MSLSAGIAGQQCYMNRLDNRQAVTEAPLQHPRSAMMDHWATVPQLEKPSFPSPRGRLRYRHSADRRNWLRLMISDCPLSAVLNYN